MSRPRHCSNPKCPNFLEPTKRWYYRSGSYETLAHGRVQRYRCKSCGKSLSGQTFSIHYYAKRRLDLKSVFARLRGGASIRDVARQHHVSRTAITTAIFRLGRQSMAAHALLTQGWHHPGPVAFDGLLSFVASQDHPCHLTVAVDAQAEFIVNLTHAVVRRGGRLRPEQRKRIEAKEQVWRPKKGALRGSISLLVEELGRYYQTGTAAGAWTIHTDEHPLYKHVLETDTAVRFYKAGGLFRHRRIPGSAPRTVKNPLFPVNYVDMLLRHRMKEHTRETIAFGRHAVHQMHRAWLFSYDHNYLQPRRVKVGEWSECRAVAAGIDRRELEGIRRSFFRERLDLRRCRLPESSEQVWLGELDSPPVRWRSGQRVARPSNLPRFAVRDLLGDQHFW